MKKLIPVPELVFKDTFNSPTFPTLPIARTPAFRVLTFTPVNTLLTILCFETYIKLRLICNMLRDHSKFMFTFLAFLFTRTPTLDTHYTAASVTAFLPVCCSTTWANFMQICDSNCNSSFFEDLVICPTNSAFSCSGTPALRIFTTASVYALFIILCN